MRLKTLRKERPAFENEGALISGNRMDLSNSEFKPPKHRTNNSFALPTSLTISVNMSPCTQTPDINTNHPQQTLSRRTIRLSSPSQSPHVSAYQAIEAAYLEHGIRIHLNSTTAAAVTQQQNLPTENLTGKKSITGILRHKAFVNRNPSRPSSALIYATNGNDTNEDSRPFSALHHTSTVNFEQKNTPNASNTQSIESQNQLQSSEQTNNNGCASSIVGSERSDHIRSSTPLVPITNDASSITTLIDNDPDLAYMSSLLKTTNGDSFRDTIRRRAGLRATFAVHRHPELSTTRSSSKSYEKSPIIHSPTANRQSLLFRTSTIAGLPTRTTLSPKKIERDILKHASRIRINQMNDSSIHHHNSLRSQTNGHTSSTSNSPSKISHKKSQINEHISSTSNSPSRISHQSKRNQILKSSKSMSLEPLELLLAPSPCSLPSRKRATSLSLYDSPTINRHKHQENTKSSKKRTQSAKISFIESNNNTYDGVPTNSFLNNEGISLMKTSPLDMITINKIRHSNSVDSGCYDRSSSSGDTHSVISSTINQASSSQPSARLTSASTRRSNVNKRVSFEEQCSAIIITTETYV